MLTLHTYFRSSAAFRVRIALNLKGLDWSPAVVWLLDGEQRGDAYRTLNPQGLVPTLVDGDATLAQSMAIIEYLDETHPEPPLLPGGARDRARVRALSQAIACDIHPLNNLRVLQYLKRDMGVDQARIDGWYQHWCAVGLEAYEAQLGDGASGLFSHGDTVTMADVCLIPQVFNARRYPFDLGRLPRIAAIFERCMALPAFDAAQPSKQPDASRAPT